MKSIFLLSTLLVLATGCGHTMMRGTVAMKAGQDEAHVCLGDGSVKSGDKIAFYKNKCTVGSGGGKGERDADCKLIRLGEGTVSRTLNDHYSMVKTDGSFDFKEGTLVEKVTK